MCVKRTKEEDVGEYGQEKDDAFHMCECVGWLVEIATEHKRRGRKGRQKDLTWLFCAWVSFFIVLFTIFALLFPFRFVVVVSCCPLSCLFFFSFFFFFLFLFLLFFFFFFLFFFF